MGKTIGAVRMDIAFHAIITPKGEQVGIIGMQKSRNQGLTATLGGGIGACARFGRPG